MVLKKFLQKISKNKLSLIMIIFFALTFLYLLKVKTKEIKPQVESKNFRYIRGNFKTTMEKELLEKNLDRKDVEKIITGFSKLKLDFKKLKENDEYIITISSTGRLISIVLDRGETTYSLYLASNSLCFEKYNNLIKVSTYTVEGEIKNILWTSMSEKNIPPDVIINFAEMFAWEIDFLTEVRDGDRFKVVYELRENLRGKLIERKVIAGLYEGIITGKKVMVYFDGDYYNEKGESAKSMFLKAPLQYRRISSYFTYHRFHPILKYVRPHLGIDYVASEGTPVSSVADGIVVFKGVKGGYGNYIEIKHQYGYITSYGHLRGFARGIYPGRKVKQGEIIGYVGSTGLATGPHLDFRIRLNGKYINFLKIKRSSNKKLPSHKITAINEMIRKYLF